MIQKSDIMNSIIGNGLKRSMSYQSYRELVKTMVLSGSTTGNDKTGPYINFTKLNEQRMKRWDKTIKISK